MASPNKGRGTIQQDHGGQTRVRLDEYTRLRRATEGNFLYVGRATDFNAASSADVWQILRLEYRGGIVVDMKWAQDSEDYRFVWDSRTTYFTPTTPTGTDIELQTMIPHVTQLSARLLNAGSALMNINGAVTPVSFSFTPGAGETWYLNALSLIMVDSGVMAPAVFGATLTALTNGIRVLIKSSGVEYEYANIQDNIDLALALPFENGGLATDKGLFNTDDVFSGSIRFENPMLIEDATSDYVRITVRDNLTAIDHLRARAALFRAI